MTAVNAVQTYSKGFSRTRFRAMATPLASIFGSGFLVIVSVLGGSVGPYSVFAMIAVCMVAYLVGSVVRYNIAHAEGALARDHTPGHITTFDTIAHVALVPAYVISIALYIRILSSYALGFFDVTTDFHEKLLTTLVIAVMLLLALTKGLRALEVTKKWSLNATIAIIVLLILAFAWYDLHTGLSSGIVLPRYPETTPWKMITVLAGTLIVVQGFETTRYLGQQFDTRTRVRASRDSQIVSTIVYVLFVACATPLMHFMSTTVEDNALMTLAGIIATWLTVPLALVAVFSQFSASVADAVGGSGSLVEVTRGFLKKKPTYVLICVSAIILCWLTTTFTILALASRAFAFYYFTQCLVAASVSRKTSEKLFFAAVAAILAFVTFFATPIG